MNLHVELRPASRDEVCALHQTHMKRDFPPTELKPLPLLLKLIEQGINSVWLCEAEGRLAGYVVLAQEPGKAGLVLLDYLAVLPERRGQGWGSVILQALSRRLPGCSILIESEHPDSSAPEYGQQLRRIHFYHQAGCGDTSLRSLLFGVDYELLVLGPQLSQEAVQEGYLSLYRAMLPPDWYEKNVRVASAQNLSGPSLME